MALPPLAPAAPHACRPRCAACCIAPSISTPVPQPDGSPPRPKPAGVPCVQLDEQLNCRLFGHPSRPPVCSTLQPSDEMCGDSAEQALRWLGGLEAATAPPPPTRG